MKSFMLLSKVMEDDAHKLLVIFKLTFIFYLFCTKSLFNSEKNANFILEFLKKIKRTKYFDV